MATNELQIGSGPEKPNPGTSKSPSPGYQLTLFEPPNTIVSVFRQIRELLSAPKVTVPRKYYQGEKALPVTEMLPWYRDLPNQVRALFEKPNPALIPPAARRILEFNSQQEKKRVFLGAVCGSLAAVAGALTAWSGAIAALGGLGGYVFGYVLGLFLFTKRKVFPDIWGDYEMQPASWVNSLLVHALGLTALLLPFVISRMVQPAKASTKYDVTDISPYLADLQASAKKMGGGGGGGDRSPTPASKGAVPKFAKTQLAPPMANLPNLMAKMQVQPNLLGPPDLKLPQMQANQPWGDPQGVLGPASNGPGFGGGIGTGSGGGIGSGHGAGLGPGDEAGVGGGVYSPGGGVSGPIAIYKPEPMYSEEARKAKYQGTVVLWIVVGADGNVSNVRVVKPLGLGLDEKAVETVRTWKFKPCMRMGNPVPCNVSVEVGFHLY